MVLSASYHTLVLSILPLVMAGFLWTLAVPYFMPGMENEVLVMEHLDPLMGNAEEDNVESLCDSVYDLTFRSLGARFASRVDGNKVSPPSFRVHCAYFFLEIPNPPPELAG